MRNFYENFTSNIQNMLNFIRYVKKEVWYEWAFYFSVVPE